MFLCVEYSIRDGIVTTQELVMAIMSSKDKPDYDKIKKIAELFDENHDGSVEISDIRKVVIHTVQ